MHGGVQCRSVGENEPDPIDHTVVWQRTAEDQRRELLESSLMAIDGRLERADGVQHLIVNRMENYGSLLAKLQTGSRDFR